MLDFIRVLLDFLVSISFNLIIYLVIFHFLLEFMGTYHHPIRQYILRYTQPLLEPIHHFIPSFKNIDLGLLFLLFLLENLKLILLFLLAWQFPNILLMALWSIFLIVIAFLDFYFFAIFFRLLISWVIPIYANHPATQILFILTEPILRPLRSKMPARNGFDWTPIVALVGLKIMTMLITYALSLLGAPRMIL